MRVLTCPTEPTDSDLVRHKLYLIVVIHKRRVFLQQILSRVKVSYLAAVDEVSRVWGEETSRRYDESSVELRYEWIIHHVQ